MSVTPCVMLSRCQPDSACAAGERAAIAARETSAFRIIVPVPAGRRQMHGALYRSIELKFHPDRVSPASRARLDGSGERGRLVDAPDQARQPLRESAPLLFRQKAPNLTSTAV